MLRKVLSIVTIIIAIILLFLLVRTLVHTFTGKPKPIDTKAGSSISQSAKDNAARASGQRPSTSTPTPTVTATPVPAANATNPSTGTGTSNGTAKSNLSNTGPGETAMAVFAGTAALGAMYVVRRRQLANL